MSGWAGRRGPFGRGGLVSALRAQHGGAAAEFAIVLPAVLAALALCLGAVQLAATQLRAQDAAADAARAWARGDDASLAGRALGSASVARSDEGDLVCATVTARAAGAAGVLGLDVSARGCALGGGL
ncbi:TadE family type IV pilus minor pilin [Schumannella soli]|uniref:TadE family type IV pilus minor pilin n=1 Tax=Schumannella soli TaxID=2590779 RepID=UPI002106B97D|nr:TadE family type IV pilus minor pilin [Schumannella soli]